MSAAARTVGPNELAFFFQTNEPVPSRPLLDFLYEVERIARAPRHLGSEAFVEIVEVITGTKLVRLSFGQKLGVAGVTLAGASLAVAVAQLGNDLAGRMQQSTGRLAESVARMCLDHGVAECVITTPEEQIEISRDTIKAVAVLRDRRDVMELTGSMPERARPKPTLADEPALLPQIQDIRKASPGRASDGRIYTLVGQLRESKPGSREWRFSSQSGTMYIARGVSPEFASPAADATVVVRAQAWGREDGVTVLNVKDVFESEEP